MTQYTSDTIYTLLTDPRTRPERRSAWPLLACVGLLSWLGAVAFLGQYRANEVSNALYAVLPAGAWYWGAVAVLAALAVVGFARSDRAFLVGSAIPVAFLLGNLLYRVVVPWIPNDFELPWRHAGDAVGFMALRGAWGASLGVAMVVAWWLLGERSALRLGPGDIQRPGRDTSMKRAPAAWSRLLVTSYGGFVLVMFLFLQLSVGFRPLTNGALWPMLPLILAASLVNAAAEEYVFRGLMMPALMRLGGIGAGLWVQGAVFGLMHWGLSVGVLAALPVSLGIGFGSVIWGKAALDTGGMLWVIIAHAMIDVAVMAAYFV